MNEQGPIVGGGTPFISPSEVGRVMPDHKATQFVVKGKDETRIIQLGLCAAAWNFFKGKEAEIGNHRDFMVEFIAASNTDLMVLGLPMISIAQVEALANDPAFGVDRAKPRYYCMACPETFPDAATSNAHHDATGHNQHWKESQSYAARCAAKPSSEASPSVPQVSETTKAPEGAKVSEENA